VDGGYLGWTTIALVFTLTGVTSVVVPLAIGRIVEALAARGFTLSRTVESGRGEAAADAYGALTGAVPHISGLRPLRIIEPTARMHRAATRR